MTCSAVDSDTRIAAILDQIVDLASGNLDARGAPSGCGDDLDAVIAGLNMLAEELGAQSRAREVAVEALRRSEERFQLAMEGASDGLWDWDPVAGHTYYSPRWKQMLGYAEAEIGSGPEEWKERIHPDDRPSVEAKLRANLAGRSTQYESVYRLRHKEGHWVWVLGRGRTVHDARGEAVRVVGTHVDITERIRLEQQLQAARNGLERRVAERTEALRQSEARWRSLVEAAPDYVVTVGRDLRILFVNRDAPGHSDGSMVGKAVGDIVPEADRATLEDALAAALEDGRPRDFEVRGPGDDGGTAWYSVRVGPVRQGGRITSLVLFARDVTERRAMDRALQESEARYRHLWERLNDAAFLIDAESGAIIETNAEAERLVGMERSRMVGMHYGQLHSPGQTTPPYRNVQHSAERGGTVYDLEVVRADGSQVSVDVSASRMRVGERELILGLFHDITPRKVMTRELEFMQFAVDRAGDAIFWIGEDLRILHANEAACASLGYCADELLRLSMRDVAPDLPIAEAGPAALQRLCEHELETLHRRSDGSTFPVEVRANSFHYGGRGFVCAIARDVTERRRAERAILERDANLQALADNANDGILVARAERHLFVNRRFATMLGYSVEAMLSLPAHAVIHPDDRERIAGYTGRRLDGDPTVPSRYETVLVSRGGAEIPVELTVAVTQWSGERASLVLVRDVTARKQYEHELGNKARALQQKSDDLEQLNRELQQLVYVIAHDLKAPLRAVSQLSSVLEQEAAAALDGDPLHLMRLMRGRVQRMHALIEALLAYSGAGRQPASRSVDVALLLSELLGELSLPPAFRVEVGPMPVLHTDPRHLRQVFANLIGNAVEHHDREQGTVVVTSRQHRGQWEFSVSDDGPGIPAAYHRRVFEMFQTLEPRDRGGRTGVGLTLAEKLVAAHGGGIGIDSDGRRGCRFHFTWPK